MWKWKKTRDRLCKRTKKSTDSVCFTFAWLRLAAAQKLLVDKKVKLYGACSFSFSWCKISTQTHNQKPEAPSDAGRVGIRKMSFSLAKMNAFFESCEIQVFKLPEKRKLLIEEKTREVKTWNKRQRNLCDEKEDKKLEERKYKVRNEDRRVPGE